MPVTPPVPPAHLLMTADAVGGVWTYALDLARGLSGAGLRVTLALLGPSPQPDQRAAARDVPGLELIDTGLPLDWMAEEPAAIRRSALALGALARRLGVDLVHLNSPALAAEAGFTSAAFAAATAALHGVPPPVVVRNGRSPSHRAGRPSASASSSPPGVCVGRGKEHRDARRGGGGVDSPADRRRTAGRPGRKPPDAAPRPGRRAARRGSGRGVGGAGGFRRAAPAPSTTPDTALARPDPTV